MTMISSPSSFRKWSVNSGRLLAVFTSPGIPSSWPEDPYASGGSKVRSSDGRSLEEVNRFVSLSDRIRPVPCLL